MESKELRIGNWVMGNEPFQIEYDDFRLSFMYEKMRGKSRFEPIPLNEEWLLKFGFEKTSNDNWQLSFEKCEKLGFQMGGYLK